MTLSLSAQDRVMGVGSAVVDLLISVDEDFLQQYVFTDKGGSGPCDSHTIDRVLRASEKEPTLKPGGSAANTIRALARLGEPCSFYACVGADKFGEMFVRDMENLDIEQRFFKDPRYFTSHVLCMFTPDGQRTFLGHDPIFHDFVPEQKDFQDLKWVHIEARHLASGISVEDIMRLSKENGARISLDLSSFEIAETYREELLDLISRYVEVVFCNTDEVQSLTHLTSELGCMQLQQYCPVAVVTRADKGCLVGHQSKVISIPAFVTKPLDTTGAGDLFSAGFIYGYLRKFPLETCGRIGNKLGSVIVQVIGAELEDWTGIYDFLETEHLR